MAVLIFFIGSDARYTKTEPTIVSDTVYQQKTFTKFIKGNSIPFVVLDTIYLTDTIKDTITIVKDYNQVKELEMRLEMLENVVNELKSFKPKMGRPPKESNDQAKKQEA